jgi:diguanylate cyclase (GGDEF)-like protein
MNHPPISHMTAAAQRLVRQSVNRPRQRAVNSQRVRRGPSLTVDVPRSTGPDGIDPRNVLQRGVRPVDRGPMSVVRRWSLRTLVFPLVLGLLGATAAFVIVSLQDRADTSRQAQVQIAAFRLTLKSLLGAPFMASPQTGGSPSAARVLISTDEQTLDEDVRRLASTAPHQDVSGIRGELRSLYPVIDDIYAIQVHGGVVSRQTLAQIDPLQSTMQADADRVDTRLAAAATVDNQRAITAKVWATAGTAIAILFLLLAFVFYYVRSVRARRVAESLSAEITSLLRQSRYDAHTDALTRLPNRRALKEDLDAKFGREPNGLTLGLFDLDGFKAYNDTFGHVAGDALLKRLSAKLAAAFDPDGTAYRIGGDEFCVLANKNGEDIAIAGVKALSESGPGWTIGSSVGTVSVLEDCQTAEDALDIADRRMYADKASRKGHQPAEPKTDAEYRDRAARVEHLAGQTALALGLDRRSIAVICAAAGMYNVGLRSIPTSILDSSKSLNGDEWAFVRQHPIVGERMIVGGELAEAASLVRSTAERADGNGYPDGLRGEEIPLGSRIIAVCGAFVAMTAARAYAPAMTIEQAILELTDNAGKQFDSNVITAFSESLRARLRGVD